MNFALFITFVKIGTFTLGGGYAMLALVEQAVVKERKWLSEEEFWDVIAVCQSLPGVFAVNTALYVGHKINGRLGATFAALGAVLPSLVIVGLISSFFLNLREDELVTRIFKGIRPCVVALILAPSIRMYLKSKLSWKYLPIPVLVCAAIVGLRWSPIWFVGVAIIVAVAIAKRQKERDEKGGSAV